MISIEEQKKADEFKRQYPQHCAEFEAHMESVVTSILKELKREREAFQRSIGLIK